MAWEQIIDSYNRKARLAPALLVTLPLSALAIISMPTALSWWGKGLALLVASGLPFAVMQIVRDRGRRVEPDLFSSWGGAPTTTLLRWTGPEPRSAVSRRHALLSRLVDVQLPTEEEEQAKPREAEAAYAIATTALRESTRDNSRFALLHDELTAYGFRRNTFGCRPLGVMAAIFAAVALVLLAWFGLVPFSWEMQASFIAFDCIWIIGWWRICTSDWVRRAGENYARQLFASLEFLASKRELSLAVNESVFLAFGPNLTIIPDRHRYRPVEPG